MSIYEHVTSFAGRPVVDWEPGDIIDDPANTIPRIRLSYEDAEAGILWVGRLAGFLETPGADQIPGLVVGTWDASGASEDTSEGVIQALVAVRDRLPNLRAIFLGDIISEESEISWIQQSDVSPLFAAYPDLETFCVRGGERLSLGRLRLPHLRSLVVQSGGLSADVVRSVAAADLPALTHLELWLGTENYGGNAALEDLAPILAGDRFPALEYLGLRDSEHADDVAAAVAQSPLLERIQVLDLSLGNLSDTGLEALLNSPAVRGLRRLDIHFHYCTPSAIARRRSWASRSTPAIRRSRMKTTASCIATFRSASSSGVPGNFVVVGNPGSRRVELFESALQALDLPPPRVVSYADLLAGRTALPEIVEAGDIVRIESPGKDWEVERAILLAGAGLIDDARYERLSHAEVQDLPFDRGRIWPARQWYLGWCALLDMLAGRLRECPAHSLMMDPHDIAIMFDKSACHARLEAACIAVAPALGEVDGFDDLVERMRTRGWSRVFVKSAHGSSASGAVALEISRDRQQAFSTVEVVESPDCLRLYNSRRLQIYRRPAEIARLIDALCRHRVHVERWLPKAGIADRTFDLRVVVIAGRARHVVVRLSHGPMTNLHLLNARGEVDAVVERMGEAAWAAARATCERTMTSFPNSLYGGIDLLVEPGYRRHAVLEVNAFGDLLPGLLWQGQDTYTAEVEAIQHAEVYSQ